MVSKTGKTQQWLIWIYSNEILNTFKIAPRIEISRELSNIGWRVDLVAPGPAGRHYLQGIEVLCFPQPNIYLLRNIVFHFHVVRYILQNWDRISVIMFSQLSVQWITPLRLIRYLRPSSPVFVMDTRTVPMEIPVKASVKDKFRIFFYYLMNKLANIFADGQTTITHRMANYLSIPTEKLWGVWPSGVSDKKFAIGSRTRGWPGKGDPIIIIYIGTLNYERNLMELCHAVVEANRNGMNFHLWLYGEGTEKHDLQVFADHADSCIKVHDAIPNDDIPELLSRVHVGALPFPNEMKFRVSSPIKLFEYMGSGLPILATKIVCHTDVIGDGNFVFWSEGSDSVDIFNALRNIWRFKSKLAIMGKNASVASNNWTWASSAKKLDAALMHGLKLYNRV